MNAQQIINNTVNFIKETAIYKRREITYSVFDSPVK